MKQTSPKPCPFCGSTTPIIIDDPFGHTWRVRCVSRSNGGCDVLGPTALTKAEAVDAWNGRAKTGAAR